MERRNKEVSEWKKKKKEPCGNKALGIQDAGLSWADYCCQNSQPMRCTFKYQQIGDICLAHDCPFARSFHELTQFATSNYLLVGHE